jgi:hypothetical protein
LEIEPFITAEMRSRPMPVSIDRAGRSRSTPSGCRSNSMKTLFQISTKRSEPAAASVMKSPVPGTPSPRS